MKKMSNTTFFVISTLVAFGFFISLYILIYDEPNRNTRGHTSGDTLPQKTFNGIVNIEFIRSDNYQFADGESGQLVRISNGVSIGAGAKGLAAKTTGNKIEEKVSAGSNIVVGTSAGSKLSFNATGNILVGYSIAPNMVAGNNNIGIGNNTMLGLSSGSNNISIGNDVKFDAEVTNCTVLGGNIATVTNSNDVIIGNTDSKQIVPGSLSLALGSQNNPFDKIYTKQIYINSEEVVPITLSQIDDISTGTTSTWSSQKINTTKADITYVDTKDDDLQTNINAKADTTYVDTKDGDLQTNINAKADTTYVDTQDNKKLNIDGTNAMTANLNAGTNKIINCVNPTAPQDVATMDYVDSQIGGIDYSDFISKSDTNPQSMVGALNLTSISLSTQPSIKMLYFNNIGSLPIPTGITGPAFSSTNWNTGFTTFNLSTCTITIPSDGIYVFGYELSFDVPGSTTGNLHTYIKYNSSRNLALEIVNSPPSGGYSASGTSVQQCVASQTIQLIVDNNTNQALTMPYFTATLERQPEFWCYKLG